MAFTDPMGNQTTYGYDADGQQTSLQNALLHTTTYTYDAEGNLMETCNMYTKGEWIITGPGNGYEARILECNGPEFPSAYKT